MSTTPVSKAKPATRSVPRTATAKTQTKAPAAKAPSRAPKASAAPPRPAAKPATKLAPGPAHELPYLRFHHSQALRQKTHTVLNALEAASSHRGHGEALADLVAELVVAGMDWYFLRPLQRAQVGFMAEQSARLGLSGATKMINSASRGFILRMDHQQLRVVAAYIRELS
jgi:3-oxoacyl-ACP reductase-like protein